MKIELTKDKIQDFDKAASREWLETNGLGGWASSSLAGANTRSYHGILVAATNPPVGRMVLLNKFEEYIFLNNEKHELSSNQFPSKVCASGLQYFTKFEQDLFPVFHYNIGDVEIIKTIAAVRNENTVAITYEVKKASGTFDLMLKPFISYRDYHSLGRVNHNISKEAVFGNNILHLQPYPGLPSLFIQIKNAQFRYDPQWFLNFEYREEQSRGLDFTEDLFSHGDFRLSLKKGSKISVVISTTDPSKKDAFKLIENEAREREMLWKNLPVQDDLSKKLALAADQFLVKRGKNLKTIIAGYHWFSDWGRDTMISLPGICLVTGRFGEAQKILKAFAESIDKGMIPNRFPDAGEVPEYNTVDATLWFFVAIKKYLDYTDDHKFVLKELFPSLKEIITWHDRGTRYNIRTDRDGLLSAGQPGVQLTWMDAKIGNWVVTPREGKAVEINALWYNVLMIMSELSAMKGELGDSKKYSDRADMVRKSFIETFVNESKGCLYDYVNGSEKNAAIRPNQLFALSLPYTFLDESLSRSVLKIVEEKLLTPYGLRSLSPDDPKYTGYYLGNQLSRDGAYHQGTVWSWLIGPYITAKVRLEGDEGRASVLEWLENFKIHFSDAGIGTVSEIFDAEPPFVARGCIAQAWGVAEILRAYLEDVMKEEKRIRKISKEKISL